MAFKHVTPNEQIWFTHPGLRPQDATVNRLNAGRHCRCGSLLAGLHTILLRERFNGDATRPQRLNPLLLMLLSKNAAHLPQVVIKHDGALKMTWINRALNVAPRCVSTEQVPEKISRAKAVVTL